MIKRSGGCTSQIRPFGQRIYTRIFVRESEFSNGHRTVTHDERSETRVSRTWSRIEGRRADLDQLNGEVGVPLSWPRLSGVPGLASLTITNTERWTKKRKVSRYAVVRSGHMVASDAGIAWLVREAMDGRGRIKLKKLSRSLMSRAAVSATKLRHCVRKQPAKIRKCMCLPSNYALVEFPVVWSELRANQQLCDGAIRCATDQVFPVHRAILSAVSPYFKALFTNSLKGGKTEITEVAIESVPGRIFSLILDYAYTGTCNVNADNVEQLLPLADQFEVLGVVQLCCQFLLQELRPENCLGIFNFARHYFCRDLEEKGRKYICHHFKRILQESPEFEELTSKELKAILCDDELNVKNEEIVFEAIKTWLEHNVEEKRPYLPGLLKCVRYGLMNYNFFTNNVLAWKMVEEDESCQQVLAPANQYLKEQEAKLGSGEIDLNNPLAKPRIPYEILFAIGGWSAGSPTNFVETYDTRVDRWFLSVSTDATPRSYHGLCTLDNLIYMIGGFDGNQHFSTVRCFDPVTREWRERACMHHARCYVSVCTHGGKIYALGGYNGRTRMSSGERYEPQKNQWEMIPPMHQQRSDASAAALHDKIYIVGGFSGREVLNSAEVFDVESNQWTYIHPMINPRSGVSLVAFRDSLYALGGFNGIIRLNSGERYNPNSEDWHAVPEMFSPRSNFATVILDDMIFVVGGFNGSTTIAYAECYDADSNEWYDASPMNLNRSALSACVIAGLANAREYSYHGKARDLGQGQASSESQQKTIQGGEGAVETNADISTEEEEAVNFDEHVQRDVSPMNELAESVGNYLG